MYGDHASTVRCFDCKEATDIFVDQRAGEVICRSCGVVLGERCIDDGQEWRTFSSEDHSNRADPNRCGDAISPLLSASSNLNTLIEGGNNQKQTGKLQRAQGMAMKESAAETALKACFVRVREIAHILGLPTSIQEDACILLRKAEDQGLFKIKKDPRGKAMCAAVTYITCRTWGVARTMKDVSKVVDLQLRDVNKACKNLFKNMTLDKGMVRGTHIVPSLCTKLALPSFVTIAAQRAAEKASELDLVGGVTPSAVAAAAVLLICSCWRPAACHGGIGAPGRRKGKVSETDEAEEDDSNVFDGERLALAPANVALAQDVSVEAMRRPFRVMFEQRGRLIHVEFIKKHASKGVSLDTLSPILA